MHKAHRMTLARAAGLTGKLLDMNEIGLIDAAEGSASGRCTRD
ncbi:MAG: hypothetical protein WA441_02710 [Methyloceanibacter sp.]|jgi:hypothetical protein